MKRPPFDPTFAQGGLFDQPAPVDATKATKTNEPARPLNVSEAAQLLVDKMAALGKLSIQGEVSSYRGPNNSGHVYFSINSPILLRRLVWKDISSVAFSSFFETLPSTHNNNSSYVLVS